VRPYLLPLPGGWWLESYGTCYLLSAVVFAVGAVVLARRSKLRVACVADLGVAYILAMTVGAALISDLTEGEPSLRAFTPSGLREGGFVGGAAAFLLLMFVYVALCRAPAAKSLDAGAMALPLGLAVAKLGCFLHGCCGGAPTSVPWAVTFTPSGEPLHPTQLYDLVWLLFIFGALTVLHRRRHLRPGWAPIWFTLLFCAGRFYTEFCRADEGTRLWGSLRNSQAVMVAGLLTAAFVILFGRGLWDRPVSRPLRGTRGLVAGGCVHRLWAQLPRHRCCARRDSRHARCRHEDLRSAWRPRAVASPAPRPAAAGVDRARIRARATRSRS